jgi:hypothetical protein
VGRSSPRRCHLSSRGQPSEAALRSQPLSHPIPSPSPWLFPRVFSHALHRQCAPALRRRAPLLRPRAPSPRRRRVPTSRAWRATRVRARAQSGGHGGHALVGRRAGGNLADSGAVSMTQLRLVLGLSSLRDQRRALLLLPWLAAAAAMPPGQSGISERPGLALSYAHSSLCSDC